MVFCKVVKCDWNRFSKRHKRHMCMKLVQYLLSNGECDLASCMNVRENEERAIV